MISLLVAETKASKTASGFQLGEFHMQAFDFAGYWLPVSRKEFQAESEDSQAQQ